MLERSRPICGVTCRKIRLTPIATFAAIVGFVGPPATGQAMAAFPGSKGRIAFMSRSRDGIATVQPDGAKLRRLTKRGGSPSWSRHRG